MKNHPIQLPALAALALALALGGAGAANAACLDRYQIQEAVSAGQIMSLDAVLAANGVDASAEILNVAVCDQGGVLYYEIGLLNPDGTAQTLNLPAQ